MQYHIYSIPKEHLLQEVTFANRLLLKHCGNLRQLHLATEYKFKLRLTAKELSKNFKDKITASSMLVKGWNISRRRNRSIVRKFKSTCAVAT